MFCALRIEVNDEFPSGVVALRAYYLILLIICLPKSQKSSLMFRLSRTSVSKNHLMTVTSWQSEKVRKLTYTFKIVVRFCLPELLFPYQLVRL